MPILAKLVLDEKARFYVITGPSFGYSSRATAKDYATSTFDIQGTSTVLENYFEGEDRNFVDNRFEAGIQVGAGVYLFDKILLDVRYCHGFIDVNDSQTSLNRSIQLAVGVPIKFSKKNQAIDSK